MWICPICNKPLADNGSSLCCSARHSFDKSRHGYVHLLPSNRMHGKIPGDNKLMVQARRRFLSAGHYARLADLVSEKVSLCCGHGPLLDIGCGEGYYTAHIAERMQATPCYGVDISKLAVEQASKTYKTVCFAVGSAFHLPVADSSCACVTNLFAPYCGEEIARVMQQNACFIMAIPGTEHLWELKQAIYDVPYKNEVKPFDLDGFDLVDSAKLSYKITLNDKQCIQDLFMMTPYYYKTGVRDQQKLDGYDALTVTAHFHVLVYRLVTP